MRGSADRRRHGSRFVLSCLGRATVVVFLGGDRTQPRCHWSHQNDLGGPVLVAIPEAPHLRSRFGRLSYYDLSAVQHARWGSASMEPTGFQPWRGASSTDSSRCRTELVSLLGVLPALPAEHDQLH